MTQLRCPLLSGIAVLGALAFGAPAARAQDAVITGRVISDRQEPLGSASLFIEELRLTSNTTSDGRYTISVPAARVRGQEVILRVRAIGFKPASKSLTLVAGAQTVDFTLVYDVNLLQAVVVTGVQEATEAVKVPFFVSRVDSSQMPVVGQDPLTQLKGKVPGVEISSTSGRPGAQPAVLLRGPTSINSQGRNQDPLYIVDGIQITGDLPDLNPSDIESVEVVEGAAGSALYGAYAGNGVINITTRSGRRALDGVHFSLRSEGGVGDIERDFGLARFHALVTDETGTRFCANVTGQPLCARTFDYRAEQARINNDPGAFALNPVGFPVDPGATIAGNVLRQRFQIQPWPGTSYNAVAQTVHPNTYLRNNGDMTGRFGGTTFYASASNETDGGAIRFLQGFRRYSFRANVDQVIGTDWTVAVRSFYSRSTQDGLNQEGGGQAFFRLTRVPGIANVLQKDTLGRLYIRPNLQGGGSQNENPLWSLQNTERSDVSDRFIGGGTVQFTPATWVKFEGSLSYDLRARNSLQFNDKGFRTTTNNPGTNNGSIFRQNAGDRALNAAVSASFNHDFAADLRTHYLLSYSYRYAASDFENGQGNTLLAKGITSLINATANQAIRSSLTELRGIGLIAGGGLEYKNRYVLDGLIRRDGLSVFGSDQRWATFGRVAGTWLVAREPWWRIPQISELKLRGSYGTAGGAPNLTAQYETFTIGAGGSFTLDLLGNPDLRPELHRDVEAAADVELLSRYGLNVTYAHSTIDHQILPVPVSTSTGFQTQWRNAGTLVNKTWEASLNVPLIQRRDVSWSMRFIYDRNRSVITALDVPPYFYGATLQATDQIFQAKVGERLGTFYGRKFITSCSELPAPYTGDCGGPASSFQRNDQGFIIWVGAGNNPGMGITNNLWEAQLPASSAPWGVAVNWGMPIIMRGAGATGQNATIVPLGNALPNFRFSVSQDFSWQRLSVYALLDAAIGQHVWNQGYHWAHLDFLSKDVDQNGKSVQSAKPISYYYRAPAPDGTGLGGLYDILGPNNFSVEDASYAKLREVLVSYRIGPLFGRGDWTASLVGRNLLTITGYRGFDPEVGIAGGQVNSSAINAIDAFTFPNVRTFTFGLSTRF